MVRVAIYARISPDRGEKNIKQQVAYGECRWFVMAKISFTSPICCISQGIDPDTNSSSDVFLALAGISKHICICFKSALNNTFNGIDCTFSVNITNKLKALVNS